MLPCPMITKSDAVSRFKCMRISLKIIFFSIGMSAFMITSIRKKSVGHVFSYVHDLFSSSVVLHVDK